MSANTDITVSRPLFQTVAFYTVVGRPLTDSFVSVEDQIKAVERYFFNSGGDNRVLTSVLKFNEVTSDPSHYEFLVEYVSIEGNPETLRRLQFQADRFRSGLYGVKDCRMTAITHSVTAI